MDRAATQRKLTNRVDTLARPDDPDDVKLLSDFAGTKIDEVLAPFTV